MPLPLSDIRLPVVPAAAPLPAANTSTLRIGAALPIARFILPPLIKDFCLLYPSIELTVLTGDDSELTALLQNDDIEFALLTSPHIPRDLKVIPIPIRASRPPLDIFLTYRKLDTAGTLFASLVLTHSRL